MNVLSITFHATENIIEKWKSYIEKDLKLMIDNLIDVEKYIFSEVESEMVTEGKNYNLLLTFDREELREDFIKSELKNISEHIAADFGKEVMTFVTFLHPVYYRF